MWVPAEGVAGCRSQVRLRCNTKPRDLHDGLTVPELRERSLELVGTELVVIEGIDPVTGSRRFNVGWLDEDGTQVAYVTESAQFVGSS